ncbi:SEC-C metal-binding domain-containing protein [Solibacillus sp. FSL K6-1781]|uniref:Predicted metal-binding protein n=2 Tax=Solibacillus TaxID=648800 RepID=F2F5U7_SOLSS|nr:MULTISPECIES: SEC-C metal-binding domain-containing protein [Solibacillus]AMO85073.1 metal-binding protein [Solibacillus silvestris]EKB45867.1 putative metal-binding protein [Solibacillus isronensis B3W22]OBW55961.1 metal-binding protein [Solibacillus silvestris]BAK17030.1 predicted metal-binding protein [Solibacillus silvestris StLB046]
MIGRNDPCLCGSGKKYKKCCEGKNQVTSQNVFQDEIENVLQTFYSNYPERKDIREFMELVRTWAPKLEKKLHKELVEAVALDEYFFHQRPDIWQNFLAKTAKKALRPSMIELLKSWEQPIFFIGTVEDVQDDYFTAISALTGTTYHIQRESHKSIPLGMRVFAFLLPDGSNKENHVLAVSTLIFFHKEHAISFEQFTEAYKTSRLPVEQFTKENHLLLWEGLVENGYEGEEFTPFEQEVVEQLKAFMTEKAINNESFVALVEDYLIEKQPTARKAGAIAAGAVRFGQENDLFDQKFTVKEIGESFSVSPSSLNKYYQELNAFYNEKQLVNS